MTYVTTPTHPKWEPQPVPMTQAAPAITVHALRENKRPIGFAEWPEVKPKRKKAS